MIPPQFLPMSINDDVRRGYLLNRKVSWTEYVVRVL